MSQKITKELAELVDAGILTEETAEKIRTYYESKKAPSTNRLILIFSILGAILVGLGIILIVAHNWDNLSKTFKTILAFLPMVIGQGLCAFALLRKKESAAWREASAVFLVFGVGTCISLVSQVYQIQGELSSFMLVWILLCLPLIYIMPSSMTSLLCIVGITFYATEKGYGGEDEIPWLFVPLLLAVIPHYYQLWKTKRESNFFNFHSWLIAGALIIALGTFADEMWEVMWVAYIALFSSFFLLGISTHFQSKKFIANPFRFLGAVGIIVCFLILSFDWFWEDIFEKSFSISELIKSPELWASVLFSAIALYFLISQKRLSNTFKINPLVITFIVFPIIFILANSAPVIGIVLTNLFLLGTGIFYIHLGTEENHLGFLNLGLLTIAALVFCRFFDMNLSFVVRGISFVVLGAGFFIANFRIIKKRGQTS